GPAAAPRVWSAGSVLRKSLGPAASFDTPPGGRYSLVLTAPPSANGPNASRQPAQGDPPPCCAAARPLPPPAARTGGVSGTGGRTPAHRRPAGRVLPWRRSGRRG